MKSTLKYLLLTCLVAAYSASYAQWTHMTMSNFPFQDYICNTAHITSVATTSDYLYVGTELNGVHRLYLPGGTSSWTHIPYSGAASFLNSCGAGFTEYIVSGVATITYAIDATTDATGDIVVAAANGRVYRSDYGANFYNWSTGLPTSGNTLTAIHYVNDVAYTGGSNGTLYYRALTDASWAVANTALGTINSLDHRELIKKVGGGDSYHLQIGSSGGVFTRKLGDDNKPVTGFWNRNLVNATGSPLACEELVVNRSVSATANYAILAVGRKGTNGTAVIKLYRSVGGTAATTWEEVNSIGNDVNAQLAFGIAKLSVAYGLIDIDKSTDNGATWSAGTTASLATDNIRDLAFDGGTTLYAGTFKNGVYSIDYSTFKQEEEMENASIENDIAVFPSLISHQPVEVTIQSGSIVGDVSLYSLEGKLISFNKGSGSATTQIHVDALSPGIYILHIQTEEGMATRKLLVQ